MRDLKLLFGLTLLVSSLFVARRANAAPTELCGNGVDDDSDSYADEGCNPHLATGVVESPLPYGAAGATSVALGALYYPMGPLLQWESGYGPDGVFEVTYMSQYDSGYTSGNVTYKEPLGYRFQHNFMSWLTVSGSTPTRTVVVHGTDGADVLFQESGSDAAYYYFNTFQKGRYYKTFRQDKTKLWFELVALTGESYLYDATSLKLTRVRDSLASPKYLTIAYDGNGQVSTVTDAPGYRRLEFKYFSGTNNNALRYVELEHGASWTVQSVVEFTYSSTKVASIKRGTTEGSTTVYETLSYDAQNYLSTIVDGESTPKTVATFTFLNTTPGKLIREHTQAGDLGFTYNDTTNCAAGETGVYFNRYDTATSCTANSAGVYLCGGMNADTPSPHGWTFRAVRCVSYTTSTEDLVNTVTGKDTAGTCTSCREIQDYDWDTATLRPTGMRTAETFAVWTSYTYNANGLPTKRVEGDSDSDAATVPGSGRTTFYTYGNSSFPGQLTEARIHSELQAGTCDASTTTACKRTLYAYTSDGKLDTVEEIGFTYDSSGTITGYDFTTDHNYDGNGRLTATLGPRSGVADDVEYVYFSAGGLNGNQLNLVKRKKDAVPTYITTTYDEYDAFGHPQQRKDPAGKLVCTTYGASNGTFGDLVASRRVLIGANQTSCAASSNSTDETTSYTYDTHKRRTKTTKPRSNCVENTYDANGRLSTIKEEDYVSGACQSTGDTIAYTYDADGLVTKTERKDDGGVVKGKREQTFQTDRRTDHRISPIDASKYQDWAYDEDGVPSQVLWEDYGATSAQTQWDVDTLNRTSAIRRYTGASSNEAFALTPGVQLDLPTQVSDPASHNLDLKWDDLRRKVKQVTPEGGTNYYVYNEAGSLTTFVMASGTADTKTTTYTYDNMNRRLTENTGDAKCFTLGSEELQYTYDTLPGGVSCPSGSSCANLSGRLAYVKVKIYCDDAQADDMFDQATFYSYTDGGRVAQHTVKDDAASPRIGKTVYTYDKNGNVTREDYPSGSTTGAVYTFASAGNYSDDDRVTQVARDTTTILEAIAWFPFGSIDTYKTENTLGIITPAKIQVTYKREADYQLSEAAGDQPALLAAGGGVTALGITYAKDDRLRYTKRDFSAVAEKDMYFLYDNLNRVTCRTTASAGSCPGSGGANQMESITYNTSSDRTQLILNNNLISSTTYSYVYTASTSDKLSCLYYGSAASCASGSNVIAYAYDTRGNRTSDDDNTYSGTSNDARTYTYDGRNNLLTVTGKYYVSSSTMHSYLVTYAHDERSRLIFKSFKDTDTTVEAQWFYYYDLRDRLVEAKYTPNIATSGTYSVFQWYWLDRLPTLYYQLDTVAGNTTTTRRYLYSDEQGRPINAWSWPTSGNATLVWEVEPGLFGWDIPTTGATLYQPMRFPGQKYDADTEAVTLNGAAKKVLRSALSDNQHRTYDSFTGGFCQIDPRVTESSDAYGYVNQKPVKFADPSGLLINISGCGPGMGPDGMGGFEGGSTGGSTGGSNGSPSDGFSGPARGQPVSSGMVGGTSGGGGVEPMEFGDLIEINDSDELAGYDPCCGFEGGGPVWTCEDYIAKMLSALTYCPEHSSDNFQCLTCVSNYVGMCYHDRDNNACNHTMPDPRHPGKTVTCDSLELEARDLCDMKFPTATRLFLLWVRRA